MSLTEIASLGCLGALVATMVDGRRAVAIAGVVMALALAPAAASVDAATGAAVLIAAAAASAVLAWGAAVAGRRLPWGPGVDPLIPVFSPRDPLFGPRSARLAGAVAALPLASWVSFNIPVGATAVVSGILFPCIYAGLCIGVRLLTARTLEDIGVALTMLGVGAATGWMLVAGGSTVPQAAVALALCPLASLTVGWLGGRHQRRHAEVA